MQKSSHNAIGAILGLLVVSLCADAAEPVTPKLNDRLSSLLQEEMRAIQSAMAAIHSAMVIGDHETVSNEAEHIHHSFIMKQALSEQDRVDLVSAVPEGFLAMDKEFHQLAAVLAEAGRQKDTQQQSRHYNGLTQACLNCHSTYVADRFPQLQAPD